MLRPAGRYISPAVVGCILRSVGELFNAEITRFRHAWDLPGCACGVMLLSSPLADAVTSSTGRSRWHPG